MKRKTTPAIGYLRVSSKGQTADDKDGLRRQRENIERYGRTAGYDLVEWFEDGGVSGATELENRPALLDALARIASNGVKVMILEHSDRLARDLYVQEAIIKAFVDVKARILTADGIDLTEDDDSRRFIRQVMGAANEFAKRSLVRRMRAARERKRKNGQRVEGVRPFGELPGEAPIIQRVMELHRKPKKGTRLSLQAIADTLNREGRPTAAMIRWEQKRAEGQDPKGPKPQLQWTKNTVARIVARERGHGSARQRRDRNP